MTQDADSITRAEAIGKAAEGGCVVSDSQFERWRKLGLLPKPELRGRGRGQGVEALYPARTGDQLIALSKALATNRNADTAAWRIWWQSFEIDPYRVRDILTTRLDELQTYRDEMLAAEAGDDNEAEKYNARIVHDTLHRTRDKDLRRLRKRIGWKGTPVFRSFAIRFATGTLGYMDESDVELATRGFGGSRLAHIMSPYAKDVAATLRNISSVMTPARLRDVLSSVTDETLAIARDEISPLQSLFDMMPSILQVKGQAADALRDLPTDPQVQQLFLLFWLTQRDDPKARIILTAGLSIIRLPVEQWLQIALQLR